MEKKYNIYKKLLERASTLTPNLSNKTLIIDGTNTFIRVFCNVPTLNENGDHIGAIIGFLKSIGWLIRKENPTKCIIVFDGSGGSQRRRKLYPDYKKNRKPTKMNRYDEFKDLVDEDISKRNQMDRLLRYLSYLPINILIVNNIEADDVIAYVAKLTADQPVVISSSDRDFLQLVDEQISVYSPIKKILYTPKKIEEEFGLYYKNYINYRILTGDSSDNIPGINGIGLKTLIKTIPELKNSYIDLSGIVNICQDKKDKLSEKIRNNKDKIELNEKLMKLDIFNFSTYNKMEIQSRLEVKPEFNKSEFLKLFFEDNLNFILKDPHSWLHSTFNKLYLNVR